MKLRKLSRSQSRHLSGSAQTLSALKALLDDCILRPIRFLPQPRVPVTMLATSAVSMVARQVPLARVPTALIRTMPAQMLVARRGYATPSGPPPKNFRLQTPKEWDQEKESTLDRVGKYFLMTEMMRGMYLLMEQFFRPP